MSHPGEPLRADPVELRATATRVEGHAGEFRSAQDAARSRAGEVSLGSGAAGAALAGLSAAWEAETARFEVSARKHAQGHREAADAYERTDVEGAGWIGEAGLNAGG
ncbi:WXG100 family type VII secretion target [Mycobacterium sp. WMMD1722]|uniref:WXG100 family type VII secretion target n=1 Tax=Mycobacterium sp. WMMD1722 TaxID=3404117 RepID=UPI003BF4871D